MPKVSLSREFWILVLALLLAGAAGLIFYLSRATTLTIGVAPSGGTEPALLRAYAEALSTRKTGVRLKVVPFDGVRESAEALEARKVDLAVVRPDVALPANGLTLAILREQAVLVGAPEASGIAAFPDLNGRRLGVLAARGTDRALIVQIGAYYGLDIPDAAPAGPLDAGSVALVPMDEADLAKALTEKRIDAVLMLTTPTTPAARRIVGIVQGASQDGKISLFGVPDAAALIARSPRLQAVTVPAGLFNGDPRLPAEELSSVGTSYRLMARATLSRSVAAEVTQHLFEMRGRLAQTVPAADTVAAPAYETTAEATGARLPIHPGALDYYEREQESFIERYETWIYLFAFLGGGIGSALAWLQQRLSRIRRERIEVVTERLLGIRSRARKATEPGALDALATEIDDLAASIARHALRRPAEARTMSAAIIAIDAARSTVRRAAAERGDHAVAARADRQAGE